MKFLITGATGFIGSAFVRSLSSSDEVVALTRRNIKKKKLKLTLRGSRCDIKFIKSLKALDSLNDFDCVINLAGEPIADKRWSNKQKLEIQQSRWQITEALGVLFKKSENPPTIFISGSAVGFYGRQGQTPVTESLNSPHDEFTHQLCEKWESIALATKSDKVRVCVLRTGIVLEKNHGALAKMTLPFNLGLGGRIGDGTQGMSWIHIKDMVRAIHHIINSPTIEGPVNLTSPNPVSNSEFVKTLGKTLYRPALIPMPEFMLTLLMGESADLLLTGQYVIPKVLKEDGFVFKFPELHTALRAVYR